MGWFLYKCFPVCILWLPSSFPDDYFIRRYEICNEVFLPKNLFKSIMPSASYIIRYTVTWDTSSYDVCRSRAALLVSVIVLLWHKIECSRCWFNFSDQTQFWCTVVVWWPLTFYTTVTDGLDPKVSWPMNCETFWELARSAWPWEVILIHATPDTRTTGSMKSRLMGRK